MFMDYITPNNQLKTLPNTFQNPPQNTPKYLPNPPQNSLCSCFVCGSVSGGVLEVIWMPFELSEPPKTAPRSLQDRSKTDISWPSRSLGTSWLRLERSWTRLGSLRMCVRVQPPYEDVYEDLLVPSWGPLGGVSWGLYGKCPPK
jgi:hypothetical protein